MPVDPGEVSGQRCRLPLAPIVERPVREGEKTTLGVLVGLAVTDQVEARSGHVAIVVGRLEPRKNLKVTRG
jgi:hypothetical protein